MNRLGYVLLGGVVLVILLIVGLWYGFSSWTMPTDSEAPSPIEQPREQTFSESGDYYSIDAVYPAITLVSNADANARAVALMSVFVQNEAQTFKKDSGVETLTPEDVEIQHLSGERKYALGITYKTYESASTVSYVFSIYADTLGAHPNGYYRTFTFDKATGEELSIADLFEVDSDYLEMLSTTSRTMLTTQIAEATQVGEDEVNTDMIEAGTSAKIDNFAWFYLEGANLVLLFPPYSVGPWVLGTQLVSLPTSSLTQLKPAYR